MAFTRANIKASHGEIKIGGTGIGFSVFGMEIVFGANTIEEPCEESGIAPGAIFYAGDNVRILFTAKEDTAAVRAFAFPGRTSGGAIDLNNDREVGDDAIADSVSLTFVPSDAGNPTITIPKAVLVGKPISQFVRATQSRTWAFEFVGVPDDANSGRVIQYSA